MIKGGVKIGEGGFGCIYDKSLKCKIKSKQNIKSGDKKYVTKITKTKDADKLIKLSKEIDKHSKKNNLNTNEYFSIYFDKCEIDKKDWNKEKIFKNCDVVSHNKPKQYPGIFTLKASEGSFHYFKKKGKFDKMSAKNKLRFLIHLFEGFYTLNKKYIHFDIKDLNILVHKKGKNYYPIIADYDLMKTYNKFDAKTILERRKAQFKMKRFYIWGSNYPKNLKKFDKMSKKDKTHFMKTIDVYSMGNYVIDDIDLTNLKTYIMVDDYIKKKIMNENFKKRDTPKDILKFFKMAYKYETNQEYI